MRCFHRNFYDIHPIFSTHLQVCDGRPPFCRGTAESCGLSDAYATFLFNRGAHADKHAGLQLFAMPQGLLNGLDETGQVRRFYQTSCCKVREHLASEFIIARVDNDGNIRSYCRDAAQNVLGVQAGHARVEYDQVETSFSCYFLSLASAGCCKDAVPLVFQYHAMQQALVAFLFYEKQGAHGPSFIAMGLFLIAIYISNKKIYLGKASLHVILSGIRYAKNARYADDMLVKESDEVRREEDVPRRMGCTDRVGLRIR